MLRIKKIKNRGKRTMSYVRDENVDRKAKPCKALTSVLKKRSGRMRTGKISVRHRGGGTRRRYRQIDFRQAADKVTVERVEKDPNRSCFIALVKDKNNQKYYYLACNKLKKGDVIYTREKAENNKGNRSKLKNIQAGSIICNVELYPDNGGKIARSAGSSVKLMGIENGMAQLKMPSGEIRLVKDECYATIGQMSNPENSAVRIGKAGRTRNMGKRPQVRGKTMNAKDHPHGGGEGLQSIGMPYPKTKWGKHALGVRTRPKKKASNKHIIRRRSKKRK
ncbi:MAG: 50S ribosomal protein L2 [Candidatus Moranbacteria bacterium]|nr:50S ribosomal protein L2 [Candidatus Moranbacteria bacterium]